MEVRPFLLQRDSQLPENPLPEVGKIRHGVHQFLINPRSAVSMPVVGEEAGGCAGAAETRFIPFAARFNRGLEGAGHPHRVAGHGNGGC